MQMRWITSAPAKLLLFLNSNPWSNEILMLDKIKTFGSGLVIFYFNYSEKFLTVLLNLVSRSPKEDFIVLYYHVLYLRNKRMKHNQYIIL